MEAMFMKLVEMSISASWLVLVVLLLRFLLKKSPRWIHVALWATVALRLICPLSLESAYSLNPADLTDRIVEDIPNSYVGSSSSYWDYMPEYQEAVAAGVEPVHGGDGHYYVVTGKDHLTPALTTRQIAGWIWIVGITGMLAHAMVSYRRVKKQVGASLDLGNGVFLCDYIDTPFILGIFRPKIYLPSPMDPDVASHVLAHERAHIARRDHWWKPFGYLLLTVYWFNPLLWLAYILLCRDIELACDEKVIRDMECPQKKAYSEALLNCSTNRRTLAACPLAFGEVGVKERVKSVLSYRKPTFWIVLAAVAAVVVTAVCFLTEPSQRSDQRAMEWFEEYAYEQVRDRMGRDEVLCIDAREGYALVFCRGEGPVLTLYSYEKQGKEFIILDSYTGEYAISAGMSLNHLEDQGRHIYFGTASQYHWNPQADVDTWLNWNYLELTDENGKSQKKDMLGNKEGFLFILDAPMADFSAVDCLDTECLNLKIYTEQGYFVSEVSADEPEQAEFSSPYQWTSAVKSGEIQNVWAFPYGDATYSVTIEGSRLEEMIRILQEIEENEMLEKKSSEIGDSLWDYDATRVYIYRMDGMTVWLRYLNGAVNIGLSSDADMWKTDDYWVIENQALTSWMEKLANGGTYMLTDENRGEIRQLLRMEHVQFFDPREYEDLLFVGCAYDNGRGMGVACFEKTEGGYKLRRLLRESEVKRCASGDELYYCDYGDLRIFLILNRNITGMEWAGAYQNTYAIDTHPGLVVESFPEDLDAMYRFHYGGRATTMYMDRQGNTYAASDMMESVDSDSGDAFVWCSTVRKQNVEAVDISVKKTFGYDNFAMPDLAVDQLLRLLNALPEAAFSGAQRPEKEEIRVQISCSGMEDERWTEGNVVLSLKDDVLYYTQQSTESEESITWCLASHALKEFIQSLGEDGKTWWNELPLTGGIGLGIGSGGYISTQTENVEISIPKFDCFQYETNEDGIRFKPEDQEGWIQVQYQAEPFAVCGTGLETCDVSYKNGKYTGTMGFYDGNSVWSFVDVKTVAGDMVFGAVLLNAENAPWVTEYHYEITQLISEITFRVPG